MTASPMRFSDFYRDVFLQEHLNPANIALHVLGTLLGLFFVMVVLLWGNPWFSLAFPVVHAVPGLLGHRLFERHAAVGDVRVTRRDYSPLWFIAANHRMTVELALKGFHWRGLSAASQSHGG